MAEKKCPFCKEIIQSDAIKCRFCGEWLKNTKREGVAEVDIEALNVSDGLKQKELDDTWFSVTIFFWIVVSIIIGMLLHPLAGIALFIICLFWRAKKWGPRKRKAAKSNAKTNSLLTKPLKPSTTLRVLGLCFLLFLLMWFFSEFVAETPTKQRNTEIPSTTKESDKKNEANIEKARPTSSTPASKHAQPAGQTTATQAEPVAYEIVESEDQSRKAITKRLSSYTYQELVKLPIDKRMEYRVVVSPTIKENQVRPTIEKIIADITSKDNDIDEISLFLYSDKELANGMYDVARATWAPGGRLGNITPEIARSNDRTDYKITIQIARNLEQYLQQRAKSEQKFGFTEAKRRRIFKEIVAVEDKAQAEADRKYPISGRTVWGLSKSELRSQIDKNIDLMRHLEKQYKKELSKKYGLTQEQLKKISLEGVVERWPMPKFESK